MGKHSRFFRNKEIIVLYHNIIEFYGMFCFCCSIISENDILADKDKYCGL